MNKSFPESILLKQVLTCKHSTKIK